MGTAYSYLFDGSDEYNTHGWNSITRYEDITRIKIKDKNKSFWIGDKIKRLYNIEKEPVDISEIILYDPFVINS